MTKIAIISDIHGNVWALEKVLKDIEYRNVDLIINLGDSLYGPLKPMETYKIIQSSNMVSISGNQDRDIIDSIENHSRNETMQYVLNDLSTGAINWLKSLPYSKTLNDTIFAIHGTPDSDITYLLEDLHQGFIEVNSEDKINEYLKNMHHKIILCGHSHKPRIVSTENTLIINPGSVGLQAYDDDTPIYHKIENYTNLAHYSLVEICGKEIKIAQMSITYDFEKAVECSMKNNRMDWAKWLKYGKV